MTPRLPPPPPHRSKARRSKPRTEREILRDACLRSHEAFMETVWKDSDGRPVVLGEIHRTIIRFLDRAQARKIPPIILAPRGIGKTEILLSRSAWRIAKNPSMRYQIISDILENAQDRLGSVRQYIERDKTFRWLFPEVVVDRSKRGRRTLSKLRLTANKHAKDPSLEACAIFGGHTGSRADEQAYDDLCNEKNSVAQPADRTRLKKLFFKTWTPILVPGGWWFYIGTLYHEDDLTHACLANKRIAHLKIGLSEDFSCYDVEEWWPGDEEPRVWTIPLWTEGGWDADRYRVRFEEMLASGDASAFFGQYRNILVDPESAAIRPEWFSLIPELRARLAQEKLSAYTFRVVYADPAFSKKKEACYYSGVVMGWHKELERGVVLHAWREKEGLSARVDRFLDAVESFEVHEASVEGQHEGGFAERVEERAIERGIGIRIKRPTHGLLEKDARIRGMAPLLQHGKVLADGDRWPFFKSEALVFPNGKKDGLDALEGAWSRLKIWVKARAYIPRKFPVAQQFVDGMLPAEPHRYHFSQPKSSNKRPEPGVLAETFLR